MLAPARRQSAAGPGLAWADTQEHSMKIGRIAAPVLLAATACTPALAAVEGYTVVDPFDGTTINAENWLDQERVRSLTGTALRHIQRDVGRRTSNSSGSAFSWSSSLSRPTPVTQLRGIVRVGALSVTGCGANGYQARARARLLGTFFNTGVRTTGSNVGDVLAQVWMARGANSADPAGVMRVEGWVGVCLDATCQGAQQIGSTVSLGTASVGDSVTLAVEWDRAAKTFNFLRDGGASSGSVTYTVNDSFEPSVAFKTVGTRTEVPNCTATAAEASIDATFDTISVNVKAKP
jgi:hypothetical protein